MNVRWRLGVLFAQLALLILGTYLATGALYSTEVWFLAGLLAVVVNPQLLEPFYHRPGDVVANSIIGLFLYFSATKQVVAAGWHLFAILAGVALLAALVALVLGAGREGRTGAGAGRAARVLIQPASARAIYSFLFWLSLVEEQPDYSTSFWILGSTWLAIIIGSRINWQNFFTSFTGAAPPARVEGMVGPSRLLISVSALPNPGSRVELVGAGLKTDGVVLGRVWRGADIWAQVQLSDREVCEKPLSHVRAPGFRDCAR